MTPLAKQVGFTVTDLLSIHMSRQFLEPLAGSPFFEGHLNVQRKVKGVLGQQAVRYIEKISDKLKATAVGASSYRDRGELIARLTIAIEDRRITLIVYQSMQATEPVEQEVYPLGMVYHRSSLYLIAWSSRREEQRTYKVDRIDEVELQNLQFQIPQDFSLDAWLRKSFGVYRSGNEELQTIRVHFSRDAARYVAESNWHPSQKLEPQKDGSLIAEFQLPDTLEIKRWIMSFGVGAKVLEPESLVKEINEDLTKIALRYAEHVD
jgi:predicted DNA-binding transcriptional regulator YafY